MATERIMRAMSRPAASVVLAAFLLASAGVTVLSGAARADVACPTAPGAAAPAGQHWYYRFDRATHRKCWFTHAIGALSAHAGVGFHSSLALAPPPVATPPLPAAATLADAANGPGEAT